MPITHMLITHMPITHMLITHMLIRPQDLREARRNLLASLEHLGLLKDLPKVAANDSLGRVRSTGSYAHQHQVKQVGRVLNPHDSGNAI